MLKLGLMPMQTKGYTVLVWMTVLSIVTAAVFFIAPTLRRTLQEKAESMAEWSFWKAPVWNGGQPWPQGQEVPQFKGETNTYTDTTSVLQSREDISETGLHNLGVRARSTNAEAADSLSMEEGSQVLLRRLRPSTR